MAPLPQVFKALADPSRLRILNLLLDAPHCVCEMEKALELPQPLVSRHLAFLKNAELVRDERLGMRVQYSTALDAEMAGFLDRALAKEPVYRQDRRRSRHRRTPGARRPAASGREGVIP